MDKKKLTKELILYVVFGGLTTLVSLATYYIFGTLLGIHYQIANVISWIFAVSFAYITNKLFVFESKGIRGWALLREIGLFLAARLFSLGAEALGLLLLVDVLHINSNIAKLIMQAVVIILNYVFSKWIIFTKKKEKPAGEAPAAEPRA